WEKLYPVYRDFKEELKKNGLAYPGMIDRHRIETLEIEPPLVTFTKVYFIGLNALNACEEKYFRFLQNQKKAAFLWDFDQFYLDDKFNEAGKFMRRNLQLFPAPKDFVFDNQKFEEKKDIKLVAVSSNFGQSQQVPKFLAEANNTKNNFDNTAIVLADESLLISTLSSISPEWGTINVTMGYPVKNSVIYGFLMLLAGLLKNVKRDEKRGTHCYYRYVTDILSHQLMAGWEDENNKAFLREVQVKNRITVSLSGINFSPLHRLIFDMPKDVTGYGKYFLQILGEIYQKMNAQEADNKMFLEILYGIYQSVEKLDTVVKTLQAEQGREISDTIFFRLFSQYLAGVSVSFEGEPLSGIQVMGILETRCLDFKNLIILGLNENSWPRTFTAPSFIPVNIRRGFGLPGIDEQDAMYAYYFYRLIQRAENITATYSVVKEGINTGELSRYGYQLLYDSDQTPQKLNLDFRFANDPASPISIHSSAQIVKKLLERNSKEHPLSPSAINTYLTCSLRFYFRYVTNLPEQDEINEEIDGRIFGSIFHDVVDALYQPFVGKVVNASDFENLKKDKISIENEIRKKIAKHYFREKEDEIKKVVLEGKTLLVHENLKTYINRLIDIDIEIAPFKMESLERKYISELKIESNGEYKTISIGGIVDRMDSVNGNLRIIDYKTGNVKSTRFSAVDELFVHQPKEVKKEILQALIYSWIFTQQTEHKNIVPGIYGLRNFFTDNFDPYIKYNKGEFVFNDVKEEFEEKLMQLVTEIYSGENSFTQTMHVENCSYCPYREICQRF
ncbi:MAG: PD-(D/E)XK nuclease family protein, partial [Prolixibacteraceae bacterium]|nr:PD-(D/E)XK nuclease family protein [Prolixibacteraceae bacterium]